MQRQIILAVSALSMLSSGPAFASTEPTHGNAIVVVSPSLEAWSSKVFKSLNQKLRYPSSISGMPDHTGVVAVKFNCGETGAPEGIEIQKSSGHNDLDYATMRAVKRIATLYPLPTGLSNNQKFIVRVLFADSIDELQRKSAEMRAEAARNNAWFTRGGNVAVLELAPMGS
ncbi:MULTISPECIES: TonB family protein [unclassified Novosphingobium]|uniref:cell envelope integrity protein TolA n=1 Tax=unclassified Novosphingobium TaxID=2644732 RepID=UPI001357062F|nr:MULTISPECIES: TonB family protein [unclassified Novosphingobium]